MNRLDERTLTIVLIGAIGLGALLAGAVAVVFGRDATAMLAIASAALGVLTPSPLSRSATPPESPSAP